MTNIIKIDTSVKSSPFFLSERRRAFLQEVHKQGYLAVKDLVKKYYPKMAKGRNSCIPKLVNCPKSQAFLRALDDLTFLDVRKLDHELEKIALKDEDAAVRLKAIELAYRRKGALAPTQTEERRVDVRVDVDSESASKALSKLSLRYNK